MINAPLEIERKFLVKFIPDFVGCFRAVDVEQGYLEVGDREVRISNRCIITEKSGKGLVRKESMVKVPQAVFDAVWPLTEGKRVQKRRYFCDYGDYVIELDIYEGANEGLITAEVEFRSEKEAKAFVPPDWLGEDVTDDPKYKNANLAG